MAFRPGSFLNFEVQGLDAAVKGLAAAQKEMDSRRRKAHLEVSKQVAGWARFEAQSGTKLQRDMAPAIRPGATRDVARLRIAVGPKGSALAAANVAFWGAKKKLGWYGGWVRNASGESYISQAKRAGFASGPPNAPAWIGKTWRAGVRGQGPYVINDTVAAHLDDIGRLYLASYTKFDLGGR